MTKREFLDKLAYELGNMDDNAKAEILNDFSEHFDIAEKSGKTEEETCSILGDPREIAAEFTQDYAGTRKDGDYFHHKETQKDTKKDKYEGYEPNRKGPKKDIDIEIDLGDIGKAVSNAMNTVRDALENIPFLQGKGWKSRERGTAPDRAGREQNFLGQVSAEGVRKIVIQLQSSDVEISGHKSPTILIDLDDDDKRKFKTALNMSEAELIIAETHSASSHLSVALPDESLGTSIEIKTRSGDVSANGFTCKEILLTAASGDLSLDGLKAGKIGIKTGSGDVETAKVISTGEFSVSTGSGEIELDNCVAEEGFSISTGSGDVESENCKGQLKVSTGSGSICVERHSGTVRAGSGSGDIEIGTDEISGDISYSTGSGEIAIACNKLTGAIRMASGSGDISFQTREVNGDISAKTASGDIEIGLADNNDVKFHIVKHSRSGHVNTNYDSKNGENSRFTVKCETHSGDIDVKRIR